MKKIILSALLVTGTIFISGCATTSVKENVQKNEVRTAYIGDTLIEKETCVMTDCSKYTLTLAGITQNSIIVNYNEFKFLLGNGIQAPGAGGWYARPAFTQRLEYGRNSKNIRYKDINLQVLKIANGAITYRRI